MSDEILSDASLIDALVEMCNAPTWAEHVTIQGMVRDSHRALKARLAEAEEIMRVVFQPRPGGKIDYCLDMWLGRHNRVSVATHRKLASSKAVAQKLADAIDQNREGEG